MCPNSDTYKCQTHYKEERHIYRTPIIIQNARYVQL